MILIGRFIARLGNGGGFSASIRVEAATAGIFTVLCVSIVYYGEVKVWSRKTEQLAQTWLRFESEDIASEA